jgi:PAS domain S-box-containing protein
MLGWSLNERTGSGFDLIHPDDVNNLKNIYNKVLSNPGKSFISTHRIKHKNGTYIWLEGKMTNLLNDPSIGAVVSNFQDITERKKLEEQQALFSSIINSSDDAIISKTLDGTITSWNRGAEILFGYSATETLGKSISILMPASHLPEENDIMHRIKNGKSVDHYETERLKKDGTVIFVSLTVSPIRDPAGKIIGASKIVRDITEKRNANKKIAASEKLFRSIVQNIPKSLVIVMDRDHKFLMIEGWIMERLGYKRQDYEGKHPLEVSPKEQYEASKPLYDRVFNGEHFSIERSSPIGDYIVHFVPIRDGNGSVESAMVIALDISEIKKAQKEIEELNKNLEKKVEERTEQLLAVNKELEAFSYSVSHDLRAPLRAIDGFAKILEEDYNTVFDEEGKRLLSIVQYNARKMAELIDNLLAFSRLGKKEVQKTKIDMTELVQGALMDLNKSIKHHVEVKIHDLHVVWGDYALLHQLFFNLISNGIKYSSKKKKPIVEINSAEKNGEVIFSVADNGVGFDMQYANKLFGVFQRLHSIDEFEGTGVGLAIVQRIANKHHGKVWAESKPGKGATFYFSIPTDFSIIK